MSISVVLAVLFHRVDEKEAQYFDSLMRKSFLLFKMLFDRSADHLSLDCILVNASISLSQPQKDFAARNSQLQELLAFSNADLPDTAVLVDGTSGRLLQIVAVLNSYLGSTNTARTFDIYFDFGSDRTSPVAG